MGPRGLEPVPGRLGVRPCVGGLGVLLLACLSLVLPLYLTRGLRRVSSGLGASSAEAVAVGDWSLLFLPCPYSVEFIFSDFKQKESLCL